jgi:hypothetical protein
MNENMAGTRGQSLFFPSTPAPAERSVPPSNEQAPDNGSREPQRGPSAIALDPVAIQKMTEAELRQEMLGMLALLKRQPLSEVAAGPAHTDGTLAIKSMTAVWILSTVGKAFGRRLVRLSKVDADALRSIGGVARLIRQALSKQSAIGAA